MSRRTGVKAKAQKLAAMLLEYDKLSELEVLGDHEVIRSTEMWAEMVELAVEVVK